MIRRSAITTLPAMPCPHSSATTKPLWPVLAVHLPVCPRVSTIFELGRPYKVYYGSGGGTNVATDAAAQFVNTQNALYIQDEYFIADRDLELTFGLRYEWIDSSDHPSYNSTLSNAGRNPQ